MKIEPATRWKRKRDGQIVAIVSVDGMFSVSYKAIDFKGGHAATARKRRGFFEMEFVPVEQEPTPPAATALIGNGPLQGALAAIASDLRMRARSLYENHDEHDEVRASTLSEVANAFEEYLDGRTIDRAMFLSWSVPSLLAHLHLAATHSEARSAIIDGLVYIDGEQVTDSDAPITRATRDRFAIRCGDNTKIVKVV